MKLAGWLLICSPLVGAGQDGLTEKATPEWMSAAAAEDSPHWPSFRGWQARGTAEGPPTPTEFNVESGFNIRWRTFLPGLAHSPPVIWGDRVFVTTAISKQEAELKVGLYGDIASVPDEGVHSFELWCLDKRKGEVLWKRTCREGVPKIKRHTKASHANSAPAVDGTRVVAFFGSEGLYAFDFEGEPLWEKDLGVLDSGFYMVPGAQWGFASSPVIWRDLVLLQVDVQKNSYLAAFDKHSGDEVWRTPREEVPTWGSPTVTSTDAGERVVVNGFKHIGGYDLASGKEVWKLVGGGDIPVPTPILHEGLVFITNAHGRMAPIYAIRTDAQGELTPDPDEEEALQWMNRRRGNYMQTPIAYGTRVYFCSDSGILACYEPETGEEVWRERLGSGNAGFTASPVAAHGKLYLTSEEGLVFTVLASDEFEIVGESPLGETCMASPAISEGALFFRTRSHLVAVSED